MLLGDQTGSWDKRALRRGAGGAGLRDLGRERAPDNLPGLGRTARGSPALLGGQGNPPAQVPGK